MTITYSSASNPKYINADHSAIELTVKFDHLDFDVQFTASPNDIEPHGIELFLNAVSGQFGQVAEYAPPVVIPTALTENDYKRAVQKLLDDTAKEKGYDSMLSAASYAGYTNPFQAEALALAEWRSAVWTKCYEILADVKVGTLTAPSIEELLADLPVLA